MYSGDNHERETRMTQRLVFLGNHTVGVRSLRSLINVCDVELVVAHPPDPEDGVRYESVHDFAVSRSLSVVRSKGKDPDLISRIRSIEPDLIWTTDYRYLLPTDLIQSAKKACINLHPSLLPKYRGRAPLNWAILNGESEVGLTAHIIDDGVDTGPIVRQRKISISQSEDVGDILRRFEPLYESISLDVIGDLESGDLSPVCQPDGDWGVWPRRTPEDGRIDWSKSANDILNLIRAVASPYPGARTRIHGEDLIIWSARAISQDTGLESGCICSTSDSSFCVQAGSGQIEVLSYTRSHESVSLSIGDRFDRPRTT